MFGCGRKSLVLMIGGGRLTSPTDQIWSGSPGRTLLPRFKVWSNRNKGACVSRQAGAKSEVDNQLDEPLQGLRQDCRCDGKLYVLLASGYSIKWHLLQLPFDR